MVEYVYLCAAVDASDDIPGGRLDRVTYIWRISAEQQPGSDTHVQPRSVLLPTNVVGALRCEYVCFWCLPSISLDLDLCLSLSLASESYGGLTRERVSTIIPPWPRRRIVINTNRSPVYAGSHTYVHVCVCAHRGALGAYMGCAKSFLTTWPFSRDRFKANLFEFSQFVVCEKRRERSVLSRSNRFLLFILDNNNVVRCHLHISFFIKRMV